MAELARTFELIGFVGKDGGVSNPSNVWGGGKITAESLDKVGLTGQGKTLHRLAEVDRAVGTVGMRRFVDAEILGLDEVTTQ